MVGGGDELLTTSLSKLSYQSATQWWWLSFFYVIKVHSMPEPPIYFHQVPDHGCCLEDSWRNLNGKIPLNNWPMAFRLFRTWPPRHFLQHQTREADSGLLVLDVLIRDSSDILLKKTILHHDPGFRRPNTLPYHYPLGICLPYSSYLLLWLLAKEF